VARPDPDTDAKEQRMKIKSPYPLVLGIVLTALAFASLLSTAEAAPTFPTHKCGSFTARKGGERNRVTVLNRDVSCKTASAVIEAFWGPAGRVSRHGGPSEAQAFFTIEGFPGWRCTQGAGAGLCRRGSNEAGYAVQSA
jgi:hypothetical protein